MNEWHVYEFIKNRFWETGRFPTNREIAAAIPGASLEEIRKGQVEAELAYEHEWKHCFPMIHEEVIEQCSHARN